MPDPSRRTKRVHISPPLPLPVHFALLPSLLPGKTLSPVLYTLVNDVPIYLTLDPSRPPHLSLLPLFLTLRPIPPLGILTSLRLAPESYTLTMDGIAPHTDVWVPISLAREIIATLGVGKLFWDADDPTRGLLAMGIDQGMSWDDGEGVGHNWLPPANQIPRASYSLSQILSTPMSGISIIQDNRFITTPLDHHVRVKLIAQAEQYDHTKMREGPWKDAWEDLLILSDLAWKEYLLDPSAPQPSHRSRRSDRFEKHLNPKGSDLLYTLLPTLPTLIHPSQRLNLSVSLPDLQRLLHSSPVSHDECASPQPHTPMGWVLSVLRQAGKRPQASPDEAARARQYKARMGISLVEAIGGIMVSSWLTTRSLAEATGESVDQEQEQGRGNEDRQQIWIERVSELASYGSGSEKKGKGKDVDELAEWSSMIHHLEQRRGGSPPSSPSTTHRDHGPTQRPMAHSRAAHHPAKHHTQTETELLTPPQSPHAQTHFQPLPASPITRVPHPHDHGRGHGTHHRQTSLASSEGAMTPEREAENNIFTNIVISSELERRTMLSENVNGWQPYKMLGWAIFVGLFLGYFQLF